jgi:hypothetical protein
VCRIARRNNTSLSPNASTDSRGSSGARASASFHASISSSAFARLIPRESGVQNGDQFALRDVS